MAKEPPKWIDALGREVPAKYVSKYDKANDRIVRRIYERQKAARAYLEKVMIEHLKDFEALRDLRAGDNRPREGAKGNISATSFDGTLNIRFHCKYDVQPDDRLNTAREQMEHWVREQVKGAQSKVAAVVLPLIQEAFRPSVTGGLSMARIASLLRIEIRDSAWQEARALMIASLRAVKGKQYIEVLERFDRNRPPRRVTVNLADCWPEESEA